MQNLINEDLINVQENKREKMSPKGKIMSLNATTICTWQPERERDETQRYVCINDSQLILLKMLKIYKREFSLQLY